MSEINANRVPSESDSASVPCVIVGQAVVVSWVIWPELFLKLSRLNFTNLFGFPELL